jgi:hypothetical protein
MELRLEGTITEDRHLEVDLPADATLGAVEVAVRAKGEMTDFERRNQELLTWLRSRDADSTRTGRTREEVDAYLQAERDSWG